MSYKAAICALYKRPPGVYAIVNNVTRETYIGSSVNVYNRLHQHFCMLRKGKHHNTLLQKDWNKYTDQFMPSVLEYCAKETLIANEQKWIQKLNPHYNRCDVLTGVMFTKRSEETRKLQSDIKKKMYSRGAKPHNATPVTLFDKTGKPVGYFNSLTEAVLSVNVAMSKVRLNKSFPGCRGYRVRPGRLRRHIKPWDQTLHYIK